MFGPRGLTADPSRTSPARILDAMKKAMAVAHMVPRTATVSTVATQASRTHSTWPLASSSGQSTGSRLV